MSSEIAALLAQAAPAPAGPPDVGSIMRRGDRVRARRVVASVVGAAMLLASVWAGAQVDFRQTNATAPSGSPACDASGKVLVFLTRTPRPLDLGELSFYIRRIPRVVAVTYVSREEAIDEFMRLYDIDPSVRWPTLPDGVRRPRLEVWVDAPHHADEVATTIQRTTWRLDRPTVDMVTVAGTPQHCDRAQLEDRKAELEEQIRRSLERAEREMRRRR